MKREIRSKLGLIFRGYMKEISLTQGKIALVDDSDFVSLNQHKWYAQRIKNCWYAARGKPVIYMHKIILNVPVGFEIDHQNNNGLDNQRRNLRICTHAENTCNQRKTLKKRSSIYKGIHWCKDVQNWMARIRYNYKLIYLGRFNSEIEAALAYDKAATKLFGEFACLNFPVRKVG